MLLARAVGVVRSALHAVSAGVTVPIALGVVGDVLPRDDADGHRPLGVFAVVVLRGVDGHLLAFPHYADEAALLLEVAVLVAVVAAGRLLLVVHQQQLAGREPVLVGVVPLLGVFLHLRRRGKGRQEPDRSVVVRVDAVEVVDRLRGADFEPLADVGDGQAFLDPARGSGQLRPRLDDRRRGLSASRGPPGRKLGDALEQRAGGASGRQRRDEERLRQKVEKHVEHLVLHDVVARDPVLVHHQTAKVLPFVVRGHALARLHPAVPAVVSGDHAQEHPRGRHVDEIVLERVLALGLAVARVVAAASVNVAVARRRHALLAEGQARRALGPDRHLLLADLMPGLAVQPDSAGSRRVARVSLLARGLALVDAGQTRVGQIAGERRVAAFAKLARRHAHVLAGEAGEPGGAGLGHVARLALATRGDALVHSGLAGQLVAAGTRRMARIADLSRRAADVRSRFARVGLGARVSGGARLVDSSRAVVALVNGRMAAQSAPAPVAG
mmetsp:Transcript_15816/g.31579  ORF Transcript_15816/g.31579 Transcript_15816/m.31579 type:complete len:499 (+) Transcript_15816:130-1626(+)